MACCFGLTLLPLVWEQVNPEVQQQEQRLRDAYQQSVNEKFQQEEEEERAHYGAYLKKRIRPAVERLILEDDWEKIEKFYENEWFEHYFLLKKKPPLPFF